MLKKRAKRGLIKRNKPIGKKIMVPKKGIKRPIVKKVVVPKKETKKGIKRPIGILVPHRIKKRI